MAENNSKSTYGKRPLWQWIAIYLVIGGIIYGLIYYFFLGNKSYNNPGNTNTPQQQNPPGY